MSHHFVDHTPFKRREIRKHQRRMIPLQNKLTAREAQEITCTTTILQQVSEFSFFEFFFEFLKNPSDYTSRNT
jgi:hypothetical protein